PLGDKRSGGSALETKLTTSSTGSGAPRPKGTQWEGSDYVEISPDYCNEHRCWRWRCSAPSRDGQSARLLHRDGKRQRPGRLSQGLSAQNPAGHEGEWGRVRRGRHEQDDRDYGDGAAQPGCYLEMAERRSLQEVSRTRYQDPRGGWPEVCRLES